MGGGLEITRPIRGKALDKAFIVNRRKLNTITYCKNNISTYLNYFE